MKATFYGVLIFSCGIAVGYLMKSPPEAHPETAVMSAVQKSNTEDNDVGVAINSPEFKRIYSQLGLGSKDAIYEIDGVAAPEGFTRLISAYRAGKVCVRYRRDDDRKKKLRCLIRDAAGDRVIESD